MAIFAADVIPLLCRSALRVVRPALLLGLLAVGTAHALGLGGELRVYSALNQPLQAELPLYLAAGEAAEDVHVRLADRDAYRRMGMPYHEGLPPFSFLVTADAAGRPVIQIASREPLREPALELLLDVRSRGGRLLRRYALLLDPSSLFVPPVVAAPAPTPAAAAPAPAAVVPVERAAAPAVAAYGPVQRGETLSQIAQRLKPEGVGTPQMTVALFEANPHAFIGGNMNRLRWGTTLYMPTAEAIAARSRGAAGKVMLEQQQALQGAAVETAKPAPVLQILTPTAPDAGAGELEQRLAEVRRLNETVEGENEELRLRLLELEQQARRLAEQVLALPESAPAAERSPAVAEPVPTPVIATAPPETAVEISTASPSPQESGWEKPSRWVVALAVLVVMCVALLGWLLWRRSRRWEYRDLALALQEDAEAKERARQELLEKARHRLR